MLICYPYGPTKLAIFPLTVLTIPPSGINLHLINPS